MSAEGKRTTLNPNFWRYVTDLSRHRPILTSREYAIVRYPPDGLGWTSETLLLGRFPLKEKVCPVADLGRKEPQLLPRALYPRRCQPARKVTFRRFQLPTSGP